MVACRCFSLEHVDLAMSRCGWFSLPKNQHVLLICGSCDMFPFYMQVYSQNACLFFFFFFVIQKT
jgi:hypothetical protein